MGKSIKTEDIEAIDTCLASANPLWAPLRLARELRSRLEPELARRASELHELRARAQGRLPEHARLWLSRQGLEQASRQEVAALRAARFAERIGTEWVLDATAGLGGDSMALAQAGPAVHALERSAELCRMLRHNLSTVAPAAKWLVSQGDALNVPSRASYLLLDPDRRPRGRRTLDPEDWSPPLSKAIELASAMRGACLKLAPAHNPNRNPSMPPGLPHTWQWVGFERELAETALWTGELARGDSLREVLVIRSGGNVGYCAEPREVAFLSTRAAHEVPWIFEPHPALVCSDLLGSLAHELGHQTLGPEIAFLGGQEFRSHPLLKAAEVLGSAPCDAKQVRKLLRRHDVGPIEVRKRGHPQSSAELAKRWRGSGKQRGRVLVSRLEQGHRAYLVRPQDTASTPSS